MHFKEDFVIISIVIFILNPKFPLEKKTTQLPRSLCSEVGCHMTSEACRVHNYAIRII